MATMTAVGLSQIIAKTNHINGHAFDLTFTTEQINLILGNILLAPCYGKMLILIEANTN